MHNPEAYGGWYECPECHGKGWLMGKGSWREQNYIGIGESLTKSY